MTLTPEKARDWKTPFLIKLSETGNVSRASKTAKVSRQAAYEARKADDEFRAAWESAVEIAVGLLEDEAWRRAREGTAEPVFYKGEKVGTMRTYSDTLLIFLLKAHKPTKYRENINITQDELPLLVVDQ